MRASKQKYKGNLSLECLLHQSSMSVRKLHKRHYWKPFLIHQSKSLMPIIGKCVFYIKPESLAVNVNAPNSKAAAPAANTHWPVCIHVFSKRQPLILNVDQFKTLTQVVINHQKTYESPVIFNDTRAVGWKDELISILLYSNLRSWENTHHFCTRGPFYIYFDSDFIL